MKLLRSNIVSTGAIVALLGIIAGFAIFASLASAATGDPSTTNAATAITSSNATLNGTNGYDVADNTAFWVSTSTFATVTASSSPTLPAGVYGTGALAGVASSTAFSAQLSDATFPSGLLPITPGTTYYFTALTNTGGAWTSGEVLSFATLPSTPTVSSISPTSGSTAGGTSVTITGTNLTGATAVTFGVNAATGVVVNSDTSITAISPAGSAGTVNVTVTTSGGTSATSSADQFTYTAPAPLAPAISNIAVSSIGSTTATVSWTTDLPASSQVSYGTTSSYGQNSAYDGTASTTHSATLSGLSEGTVYHFAVSSGNVTATTTSSDNTFVTQSTASSTPLAVVSTTPVSTTATADGTFLNGWSWIMRLTVPDDEDAFRMSFSDWTGSAGTFQADNNVRISSPQSSNANTTATGIIAPDNNYGDWMYLTGDAAAGTPGRQIDVTIEVRIPTGTAAGSYTTNFAANSVPQAATSTSI